MSKVLTLSQHEHILIQQCCNAQYNITISKTIDMFDTIFNTVSTHIEDHRNILYTSSLSDSWRQRLNMADLLSLFKQMHVMHTMLDSRMHVLIC